MNKGLAIIIRDRLTDIPFIDLYGGLVYIQTKKDVVFRDDNDMIGTAIEYRFPVTLDVVGEQACGIEGLQDFIPNGKLKGIMYFEDGGIRPLESIGAIQRYESRLRLMVWLNSKHIGLPKTGGLITPVMADIINRLRGNPFNEGDYKKIFIKVAGIPRNNKDLFSLYTYDESKTQYLMPPYEFFAIDLVTTFEINPACIIYPPIKELDACSN